MVYIRKPQRPHCPSPLSTHQLCYYVSQGSLDEQADVCVVGFTRMAYTVEDGVSSNGWLHTGEPEDPPIASQAMTLDASAVLV